MQYPERHYRWQWKMRATPDVLWPLVADTARFIKDTRRSALHVDQPMGTNARRSLSYMSMGINFAFEEEPYEWVRPYRYRVNLHFKTGPLQMLQIGAQLEEEADGGTLFTYTWDVRARTLLGFAFLPVYRLLVGLRLTEALRHYEAEATAEPTTPIALDPQLAAGATQRLEAIQQHLAEATGQPELAAKLRETVETADDIFLSKLRPYALADIWGVPRLQVLDLCLQATRAGLFDLQWQILCPNCRGSRYVSPHLDGVQNQVHCDTCNIDFASNLDQNTELTFRPNPSIREIAVGDFCLGGPQVTPHVFVQQLLPPGDSRTLTVPFEPGHYRLRALNVPGAQRIVAAPGGPDAATFRAPSVGIGEATDGPWPDAETTLSLHPSIRLDNPTDQERLLILERTAWTDQAATAAEVIGRQVFRDLFSREVVRPGEEISVGAVTIVFTDLRGSTRLYQRIGDASAFGRVLDHFAVLKKAIEAEDGAVVKTIGDAVMAVFTRPLAGLRAMLSAQEALREFESEGRPLLLKAGVHHGPCLAVNMNDRLDYFGSTVNLASRLEKHSLGGDVVVSEGVIMDPEVVAFLEAPSSGVIATAFNAEIAGFDEQFSLWRVAPSVSSAQ